MAPGKEHMGLVINQASFLTFTEVAGLPHLETPGNSSSHSVL